MEILEYAQAHSRLMAQADIIAKVTGRLVLINIHRIVAHLLRQKGDFVSLVHDARHQYCDSRFIFFTPRFLPLLLSRKEEIDGWPINFEVVTSRAVTEAKTKGMRLVFPCHAWRIHGVSGGMGTTYDTPWKQYLKADIRHQLRRPFFWLGLVPRIRQPQ